jgi:hypothetical protein
MILNISNHQFRLIERGVYYFTLSNYPHITEYELYDIIAFIRYEEQYGRKTEIICKDKNILATINDVLVHSEKIENISIPPYNKFIYHATDIKATQKILSEGNLLSAVKVYGKSADVLSLEKSNSLWNDPPDFFEYIMFCWGNDLTGDYVVLSENFPSKENLEKGNFNPGIRFYFKYEDIKLHPGQIFDGYHPIKVKDEIVLQNYLYACIVPEQYKTELGGIILPELTSKVFYLSQNGICLYDWNKKVFDFISKI